MAAVFDLKVSGRVLGIGTSDAVGVFVSDSDVKFWSASRFVRIRRRNIERSVGLIVADE